MNSKFLYTTSIVLSLFFFGCSDDSSTSSSNNYKTSGNVIDGYLRNATVSYAGKTIKSGIKGVYSFDFSHRPEPGQTLVVRGGTDESTGEAFEGELRAYVGSYSQKVYATPLSTLLAMAIDSEPDGGRSIDDIKDNLADSLGIDVSMLEVDILAALNSSDPQVRAAAIQANQQALLIQKTAEAYTKAAGGDFDDNFTAIYEAIAKSLSDGGSLKEALSAESIAENTKEVFSQTKVDNILAAKDAVETLQAMVGNLDLDALAESDDPMAEFEKQSKAVEVITSAIEEALERGDTQAAEDIANSALVMGGVGAIVKLIEETEDKTGKIVDASEFVEALFTTKVIAAQLKVYNALAAASTTGKVDADKLAKEFADADEGTDPIDVFDEYLGVNKVDAVFDELESATEEAQEIVAKINFDGTAHPEPIEPEPTEPDPIVPPPTVTDPLSPVANAGFDQNVYTGTTIRLDGSKSTGVSSNALRYAWTLTSIPAGSSAVLSTPTEVNATFITDEVGTYFVSLTIYDGDLNSTDEIAFSTTSAPTELDEVNLDISLIYNSSLGWGEKIVAYTTRTNLNVSVVLPEGTFYIYVEESSGNTDIDSVIGTLVDSSGASLEDDISGVNIKTTTSISPAVIKITNASGGNRTYIFPVELQNKFTGNKENSNVWIGVVKDTLNPSYNVGGTLNLGNVTSNTAIILAKDETHNWSFSTPGDGAGNYTLSLESSATDNRLMNFEIKLVDGATDIVNWNEDEGSFSQANITLEASHNYKVTIKSTVNTARDVLGNYTIKLIKQ